jgi:hypothetical protein
MVLESYNCVLCISQVEETLEHLLFHCPFAASCWGPLAFHFSDAVSRFQAVEAFKLVFCSILYVSIYFTLLEHLDREK